MFITYQPQHLILDSNLNLHHMELQQPLAFASLDDCFVLTYFPLIYSIRKRFAMEDLKHCVQINGFTVSDDEDIKFLWKAGECEKCEQVTSMPLWSVLLDWLITYFSLKSTITWCLVGEKFTSCLYPRPTLPRNPCSLIDVGVQHWGPWINVECPHTPKLVLFWVLLVCKNLMLGLFWREH